MFSLVQRGREWNLGNSWSDSSLYTHRLESLGSMEMALLQFRVLKHIQLDGVF